MGLFDDEWEEDNSPIDDPEITQVIMYFAKLEAIEFKRLCKIGMKDKFPDFIKDGNISDLMLILVKEKYGNLQTQTTPDTTTIVSPESQVS